LIYFPGISPQPFGRILTAFSLAAGINEIDSRAR
jgi:hypothetical protein